MSSITSITMQRGCALVEVALLRSADSFADLYSARSDMYVEGYSHSAIEFYTARWEGLCRLSDRVWQRLDARFPQHGPTLADLGPMHGPFGSADDEPF